MADADVSSDASGRGQAKRSKDLLRAELVTREEHLRSLLESKGKPKTFRAVSSVLDEARRFLPKLASAEEERLAGNVGDISIEAEGGASEGPLIEMNFALADVLDSDDSDSDDSGGGSSPPRRPDISELPHAPPECDPTEPPS
ncbi:uncharacterized protein LOC120843861 [Ixodes scapularis]|uniref:uncharacterized protein LOC120843861 n=1 Tax=Ixodes scapularis TaxID=6945 RepID=UPI001A9D0411|nr:uncharacterized protein LOC120843861 [Ixodes scapularis]